MSEWEAIALGIVREFPEDAARLLAMARCYQQGDTNTANVLFSQVLKGKRGPIVQSLRLPACVLEEPHHD